ATVRARSRARRAGTDRRALARRAAGASTPNWRSCGAGSRGKGPPQPARQVPQVGRGFPRRREMTEARGEDPSPTCGETPGERIPEGRRPRAGRAEVELAVAHTQQDARVGPQIPELVHLVVPAPRAIEVGTRGMRRVEHVGGERLGPRMTV